MEKNNVGVISSHWSGWHSGLNAVPIISTIAIMYSIKTFDSLTF